MLPGPSLSTRIGSLRQTRWLRRNCIILLVTCGSLRFMATVSHLLYRHFWGHTLTTKMFRNGAVSSTAGMENDCRSPHALALRVARCGSGDFYDGIRQLTHGAHK